MSVEDDFDYEMEKEALRDIYEEKKAEKKAKLRERVYEYCAEYSVRNGEAPDIDCTIEGLDLSADSVDEELIDSLIFDWIRDK